VHIAKQNFTHTASCQANTDTSGVSAALVLVPAMAIGDVDVDISRMPMRGK